MMVSAMIYHSDAMVNKRCFKCHCLKPLDDFYRHPQMADGHLNKCKECAKADVNKNRAANLEYYQEYDRNRFQYDLERRSLQLDKMREWARNNPEKLAEVKSQWADRNPEKTNCKNLLNNAVRDGKVIKTYSCQFCGTSGVTIHGHHPDYTKPLEVMWLCAACHSRQHRLERERLRGVVGPRAGRAELSSDNSAH